ncbi:MAG: winged helix-turn-helix transcriptional regulator [Candidatus Pacearchaeota archaeon]|nr:winged helix-turn-helix transcriptional regulator [Candidatus Pacearchaeota archaeon]
MDRFKLNYKDQRLLELLDINSRSTLGFLAEKLNLSKQAIRIKINKFIQKGIILNYVSIIDFFKLGYNNMHLYLMLQGIDKETYNKKVEEVKKLREIAWIAELFGESNLGISILYKDAMELSETLSKINKIFKSFMIRRETYFINKHLISRINLVSQDSKIIELSHDKKILDIEKLDEKILSEIKNNARFNYLDLSARLNKKPETIKKHILFLENKSIIKNYKILLNYNRLGYLWNLCILNIAPGSDISNLLEYFKKEKRIPFVSVTIENNIIIDFLSEDYQELREFLNLLKEKNKELESYKILNVEKLIKLKEI